MMHDIRRSAIFLCGILTVATALSQSPRKIARGFRHEGNEDSCLFYARKMVTDDPGFKKNLQYAEWLADFGHCKKARVIMDTLARVERREEKEVRLGIARVFLLFRMNKDWKAMMALHELIHRFPLNKELLTQAGFIYFALRDYSRAVYLLETSLQLAPNQNQAMLYAAASHLALGHENEAASWFQQLMDFESRYGALHFGRFVRGLTHDYEPREYDPCTARTCSFGSLRHYAALPLACGDSAQCRGLMEANWSIVTYQDYFYFTHSPEFDLVRDEKWFKAFILKMKKGDLQPYPVRESF